MYVHNNVVDECWQPSTEAFSLCNRASFHLTSLLLLPAFLHLHHIFFLLQSFHIQQHTTSSWLHKMTSFFHFIDRWFAAKELWMRVEDKIRWKRRTICYINDFISFHCCFPFVFILFFFLRFFFVFASSLVAFRLFFRSFLSCCAIIFLRIFLQKFH